MHVRLVFTIVLLGGFLALVPTSRTTRAEEPPRLRKVQILHTNDFHGHVEKAAAIAAVAREARRKNPNTLFLDGGDCISGTPVSTVFKGRPIFEIMSAMGYDAAAVGNHEFDHGWKLVREFQEIADFPLLCANAQDPEGKSIGDAPHKVFDVGGVRVGVLGLLTDGVPQLTVKAASEGCTFESPVEAAKRLAPALREKCDVLVLLTHVGVDGDAALAGAVPGIDLIVGGHTHTELKEALTIGGTKIVQAWCYGQRVGIVDLTWDAVEKKVTEFAYRLVNVDDEKSMPNDPRVAELVAAWEGKVEDQVAEIIGKTEKRLNRKRLRSRIEHIYKELLGCDFGYQNMGGIRGNVEAGEITIRSVWTILPFDNTLVKLTFKGSQLPEYAKKRLGDKLVPENDYTVATNSYVGDHVDKYFGLKSLPVEDTGRLMRDEVVNWVRKHGAFEDTSEKAADGGRGMEKDERP